MCYKMRNETVVFGYVKFNFFNQESPKGDG